MKHLILMGGRPWLARDGGRELVETLIRDHAPAVRIGMCNFAQPEGDWDETRGINEEMMNKFAGETKIEIIVMTPDNFIETSKWANIIYIPGGHTLTLKKRLQPFDIAAIWDGKTIAGASAGAHLLCKRSVYLQDKTIVDGLGWVNVSLIVHWRAVDFEGFTSQDWDWAEQTLRDPRGTVPLICIQEDKFVEVTV